MPQPLIELGGKPDAAIMHIAVANGFPPQTYSPLLRPFMEDYRVISLPPRALWGNEVPPDGFHDWWMVADDLLAGLDTYQLNDVIAIGHSFGGIVSLLAVIKEPERFKALIMLDPTILMPNILSMIQQAWDQGVVDQLPMVQGANRRRRQFDSVDDAFMRFRGKRLFEGWSDEVLRFYVEHGTQPASDGNGVELTWSAEWEAYYFSTVQQTIWDDLPKVNGLVPTLIIRGGTSNTFVAESINRTKSLIPSATFATVDGHGHLFPQSDPQSAANIIQEFLTHISTVNIM